MIFLNKIKTFFLAHKLLSILFLVLLAAGMYYWLSPSADAQTTYVLGEVKRGSIISSIDGSGQVIALNQVDIKSEVSGDITWIGAVAGQEVKSGQAIATIDNTDALKSISEAQTSLAESKLQLDKDSASAPIDYQKQLESLETNKKDLEKTYENAFNTVSNTFLDLPTVITGLQNILYGTELSSGVGYYNVGAYQGYFGYDNQNNILINSLVDIAIKDYNSARENYDANFLNFKDITRYAERDVLEELLSETLSTVKAMAQAAKSEQNLLGTIVDLSQAGDKKVPSAITTFQSSLKGYISTINSNLNSLLSQQSSLDSAKQAIINTQRSIDLLLINNPTGNNPISLQVSKNNIAKQESNLAELKADLAKYTIRAPFDGTIAKVSVKKLDSASNGTTIATIVTNQQLAEISLNEIDAANVKVNQKATLTFDAVDGLNISGVVSEVDTVGTVSQGVVNYTIKILFDTQDSRIKPGMSVSAAIITDVKSDILLVSSAAVKTSQGVSYVEMPNSSEIPSQISVSGVALQLPTTRQQVETGATNGTNTEITSGLEERDVIIVRTISGSSSAQTTTSTNRSGSSLRIPGMGF